MAVTPTTIAVALGRTAPSEGSPESEQWSMWISDALMLIDARKAAIGSTDALDEAKVDYVVREGVAAHVRRPDDATQVTIAVDDANSSRTYRSSKGRIDILDEWWALLGLTGARQAFAVDTASGGGTGHAPWCSLYFGGGTCSCGVAIAGSPIYEPWGY